MKEEPDALQEEVPTDPGLRTPTASCCRPCTAPGRGTGGSWECRSSCPRSGREGRDDGG